MPSVFALYVLMEFSLIEDNVETKNVEIKIVNYVGDIHRLELKYVISVVVDMGLILVRMVLV